MLTVREIWRYPVKSMRGERIEAAEIGTHGIVGDRAWGICDVDTGNILTARREPQLLMAAAHLDGDQPIITLARGTRLIGDRDLSSWLGRPVELVPAGDSPGTFENPMDVDNEADWMSWDGPSGSFHDSARTMVSLVSTATLADHEAPRFRINVILEGSGEDDLAGSTVDLGEVVLTVTKPITRCIMVSRAQPGIAKDIGVLKRVIGERDNKLGIGTTVEQPGIISVGDSLTIR